jgi:hypothetical protein
MILYVGYCSSANKSKFQVFVKKSTDDVVIVLFKYWKGRKMNKMISKRLLSVGAGLAAVTLCIGLAQTASAYGPGSGSFVNANQSGAWDVSQWRSYATTKGFTKSATAKVQQDRQMGGYNVQTNSGPAYKQLTAEVSGAGATISDFAWIW